MTIADFLIDNRTKILGGLTTLVASLLSMIALGMFGSDGETGPLLDPLTIRWMTIILSLLNVMLGGGTVAVGIANTTRERVAASAATTAVAQAATAHQMAVAVNTEPGDPVPVVPVPHVDPPKVP